MGDPYRRGASRSNGNSIVSSSNLVSSGSSHGDSSHLSEKEQAAIRAAVRADRESLILWRRPISTLHYFFLESYVHLLSVPSKIWEYKTLVKLCTFLVLAVLVLKTVSGPHQPLLEWGQKRVWWCGYWLILGVLSSIGLGTGLHTFVLYLGPHIASVTLAAYECGALNFPEPPYPDQIVCPNKRDPLWAATMWNIMCKVYLEAMMWGAGTALGELPPYFMARAARISGYDPKDEDDLREFEEIQYKRRLNPESLSTIENLKMMIEDLVQSVGFFGILACASIPNPLFDLAGLTCGHFLVPFWKFFGATLIGKAIIKMSIQQTFVILAFTEDKIGSAVNALVAIPVVGKHLEQPLKEFLAKQKESFHSKGANSNLGGNWISKLIEVFSIMMVLYFIVSLINSLAQSYHKRLQKRRTD